MKFLLHIIAVCISSMPTMPALSAQENELKTEEISLLAGRSQLVLCEWDLGGVMTARPDIVDITTINPRTVVLVGIAPGETEIYLWSTTGEHRKLAIDVSIDTVVLENHLGILLPGSKLRVTETRDSILVDGRVQNLLQARHLEDYLSELGYPYQNTSRIPDVQQVQVRVRIAEVTREATRALGVNGFGSGAGGFFGLLVGPDGSPLNPFSIGVPAGSSALGGAAFEFTEALTVGSGVTLFGGLPGDLELFIKALAENRYLRILAEPNLISRSGMEASFLAGGEFPIPVPQGGQGGGSGITIDYKEFGVGLKFTPIIHGDGKIELKIGVEASSLSEIGSVQSQGFQIPAISTRRIDTTVELFSGQTLAMGGLLQESSRTSSARVPYLSSLPVLGTLFRSVRYTQGETELVVLVTANLIGPSSNISDLPLPGENAEAPSDWELYLLGKLHRGNPPAISQLDSERLLDLGLDKLNGPGGWAIHNSQDFRSDQTGDKK
jgi:pilus assembly protein CpaC